VKNSLFVIFVWLSVSCATKEVNSDDFNVAPDKPMTFLIHPTYNYQSLSADNQQLDKQLQEIIVNGLIKQGLIVAATPDLYVTYMLNVYPTSAMCNERNDPYCGYDFMCPNYYSASEYEEGVLIIDLKNHPGALVNQGTKPFNLTSIQEVQDMPPNICRKIIKTYNYNI
jgi:hypothetical protein